MASRKTMNSDMEDHEADAETKGTVAVELFEFRVGQDRTPFMGGMFNRGNVIKMTAEQAATMRRNGIVLESMNAAATEATARAHVALGA